MDSPIRTPSLYDKIYLDGVSTPGICVRTGEIERAYQVQSQQAPGFGGAFTVCRFEELVDASHQFVVWNDGNIQRSHDDYVALQSFLASLVAGNQRRPWRSYKFLDPYMSHLGLTTVVVKAVSSIVKDQGKQRWMARVKLFELRKLKRIGGPVSAQPKNELERQLDAAIKERDQAAKELETAINAAAKAAKAGGG